MERKKIIMTAVAINTALLATLLIVSMTTQEVPVKSPEKPYFNRGPTSTDIKTQLIDSKEVEVVPLLPDPAPIVFTLPVATEPQQEPEIAAASPLAQKEVSLGLEIEVQKGDTLEKLAKAYHTRVDEIIKLNQLPSSFLRVGQRLKIPSEKILETPQMKQNAPLLGESPEYYIMKVGDNPWSIAMKHHIKVDELLKLNGLNEKTARRLKPGDRLRIR